MRGPARAPEIAREDVRAVGDAVVSLRALGAREASIGKVTGRASTDEWRDARGGAPGFALDLRLWTFRARTQAVRALGACARDACGGTAVPFRDGFERFCARVRSSEAPRGAAWRAHRLGGWRFDLRALYDAVRSRGGRGKIEGNAMWRDVAEAIGAHGRGCRAGHAARRLYDRWLAAYEGATRAEEDVRLASEYVANAKTLTTADEEVIEALIGLVQGASGDAPMRVKVENVRAARAISDFVLDRDAIEPREASTETPHSRFKPRAAMTDIILPDDLAAQGLDHIAHELNADGNGEDAECAVCGAPGDEDAMILCDGCDRGCVDFDDARGGCTKGGILGVESNARRRVVAVASASVGRWSRGDGYAKSHDSEDVGGGGLEATHRRLTTNFTRIRSHMYCLTPKMTEVPSGEWFCAQCEEIDREIELLSADEGTTFTLGAFNEACIEFDTAFFGEDAKRTGISMQVIEECFWRMVEDASSADDVCEVKCGTNIDTTKHGSGFPRRNETPQVKMEGVDAEDYKQWVDSPWNLNNVARAEGERESVLGALKDDVAGVTTPFLEVGSTFSSTTWRQERHGLYGINYNHWGAAKTWYCVPASAADKFEECFKTILPDVYEAHANDLGGVFTMISPTTLLSRGVPVYMLEQYPGEYVITFPGAYYATFNCGLNCTESVNYAPPEWLAIGSERVEKDRIQARPALFSHEELICRAAEDPSANVALQLWPEISRVHAEEASARAKLIESGLFMCTQIESAEDEEGGSGTSRKFRSRDGESSSVSDECFECRHCTYSSYVICETCDSSKQACLRHAEGLCDCAMSSRRMFYRQTIAQLETLVKKTEKAIPSKEFASLKSKHASFSQTTTSANHAKKAQAWVKQVGDDLNKLPLPPADKLKKLLTDGEKFAWGGSDMSVAREAHSRVVNAIAWQTSLASLKQRINSGRGAEAAHDDSSAARIGLNRLKELLDNPPVPMPKAETQPFRDLLASGVKLEERIKATLAEEPNPAPRACTALQSEANRFGVEVPSYKKLEDAIAKAGAWSTKVRSALPGRRQIAQRDELANARDIEVLYEEASGLPVQQSELLTVRKAIEELSFWRAKSESLFITKVDIKDAEALLKEGMGLSTKLDEVDDLARQIAAVKVWADRARASDHPQARVRDMRLLLEEGEKFSVHIDEVDWLRNRIVVRELIDNLKEMIFSKKCPLAELETAVKTGNAFLDSDDKEVAPDEEALLQQCETHIKTAKKWNERAAAIVKSLGGKNKPSLDDATSVIREGNAIPIVLDGFEALSEAVSVAKSWLDRAQPCLKGKQLTRRGVTNPIPPFSDAQQLMKESESLKLFVKEVEILEERVEAAEEWEEEAKDAIERWRDDGAEVTLTELELAHEDFGLELPAMAMLKVRIRSLKWEDRVSKIIAPKAKLVEDTVLDELSEEIDSLQDLKQDLVDEVVRRHTIVDEWRKKADRLLDPPPLEDGRLAPSASPDEIDALIAEGKALPANVSKVEDLEASLADHAVWVETVRKCLNSVAEGRPRPSIDELYELLAEVEDLTFKCSERQALTNACNAATAWTEKLNALLWSNEQGESAQKTEKSLTEMLEIVLESVKAGIEDITGTGEPPETEEGQFCLCRQAGGIQMVGCDDCGDWYHLKCINVTPTMAKTMHNYICPPCVAKSGGASALSLDTYRSVHRTNRPNVMLLRDLLTEAQRFPGEVPEEAILNQLINTHDAWRLEARKTVHRKSVKEAHENAIKHAARIAQEAATREAEERTRRIAEAAFTATMENPNPNPSLTPLQQVMLMGQAVTFAATQRSHALNISKTSSEITEVVTKQLNELQQLAMQLAMCQAQIHMAPVRSRPHILHVLMMMDRHAQMTKEHEDELTKVGANDWLMNATLQLSGFIPSMPQEASVESASNGNGSSEQTKAPPLDQQQIEQQQQMMQQQIMQQHQIEQQQLMMGTELPPAMKQEMDMGVTMEVSRNDNVDPALQVYAGMKGALAMELEPVEETLALMREVCGPAWREQATRLMTGAPFPRLVKLHELKESAVAAGLCPGAGIDPLADRAHALEVAGQIWLERAAAVVQDKTIPIDAAQMLLQEGRSLPLYLKDELEELGERCELYCVCRSAYDALRPMICCDRCDGWFHYECIGMQPPAPGEEDENAENVKFACPECCAAQGIPYVPFRPAPRETEQKIAVPVVVPTAETSVQEAVPPPVEPALVKEPTKKVKEEPVVDNKKKRKPAETSPPTATQNKSSASRRRRR